MADGPKKIFAGAHIRHLRQSQRLTQAQLAQKLGISTSYINQIENNQRSLSAAVILGLVDQFDFNLSGLILDDSGKIAVELQDVLSDPVFADLKVLRQELKVAANNTPNLTEAFLHLYKVFQSTRTQLGQVDNALPGSESSVAPLPYEEVRDYFHRKDNYIDELDLAAESFTESLGRSRADRVDAIAAHLQDRHGVQIALGDGPSLRSFETSTRKLHLNVGSSRATRLFQMAYQVGLLEQAGLMENLLDSAGFHTPDAREVCRMTFANYFAGAVILPYARFASRAAALRHDLDRLALEFGASREQVCHRLSMLQRPGQKGVPFFFVRVDRAGTVTKRHSATSFQFTRFGGSCPLWNVHQAFESNQDILTQLATTPDGMGYLCLAFAKSAPRTSATEMPRKYAIGLGCEISHADRIVYADTLDTSDPARFDPIGTSCRICERGDCSHRAVPPIARRIRIDHNARRAVPFQIDD
ncbi:helix-turn-helix domain-containing protein [Roseovarius aestuariivivens]|uniref:helix-turn-helix domain-containing protein n=1 Tax=Roseovarius aestuariivivens TaxID=1888910 RepID=UPI00108211C3|nr:XRE family transcriptional regulator [Roseovarius aestuariivivens]